MNRKKTLLESLTAKLDDVDTVTAQSINSVAERVGGDSEAFERELVPGREEDKKISNNLEIRDRQINRVEQLMLKGIYDPGVIKKILGFNSPVVAEKYIKCVNDRWALRRADKHPVIEAEKSMARIEQAIRKVWTLLESVDDNDHKSKSSYLNQLIKLITVEARLVHMQPQQLFVMQNNLFKDKDTGDRIFDITPTDDIKDFANAFAQTLLETKDPDSVFDDIKNITGNSSVVDR